jgi:nicotinate-nucleotide pyrophosphorylase (carboxylating)
LDPRTYRDIVRKALEEDLGSGDITTEATVARNAHGHGTFVAKAGCVLAGLDVALEALRQRDAGLRHEVHRRDGDLCGAGTAIAEVWGAARALLEAERTALNFLQRLSGIATAAREFVTAAHGRITILDTRKTTPLLRELEKYAVTVGGATNHRAGLFDAILIKDNHIRLAGGVKAAVGAVRRSRPGMRIEIEAQSLAQVDEALDAGADVVLADNLSLEEIRETVRRSRGRAKVEISGGVNLERIPDLANTGADWVSVGALTHSAPSADISFEIVPV